jgi:hypothetical protein
MQIFVNDREVPGFGAGGATVGEVVEALDVHVDPGDVVTEVALDGQVFSAGDDARYARRPVAGIARLVLTTRSIPALALELRGEVREALRCIVAKLEVAIGHLQRGDVRAANGMLAIALDELRLTLVLDQETARLDSGRHLAKEEDLAVLADELLTAQEKLDTAATRSLLAERLVPLLRFWSDASSDAASP